MNKRGPAYKAGVRERDLIVTINGYAVESVDDIHRILAEWRIGEAMPLVLIRGKERLEMEVAPTEAVE